MANPIQPAALRSADLEWLACPACHRPLALEAAAVVCTGCGRRYSIVDGIPVLLAGRAS